MNGDRLTWTIFSLRTINSFGFSSTMPFFAVYLELQRGVELDVIGLAYLISGSVTLVSQVVGGYLTDIVGPKKVMLFGYFFSALSSLITGYLIMIEAHVFLLLLLYPLFSFLRGFSQPATSTIIASYVDKRRMRRGFSLQTMGGNLGFAFGPAAGGFLTQAYDYSSVFVLSAGAATVSAVVAATLVHSSSDLRKVDGESPVKSRRKLSWSADKLVITLLIVVFCAFFANGYLYTPLSLYSAGFLNLSNQYIGILFATNGLTIVVLQLPIMRIIEKLRGELASQVISMLLFACAYVVVAISKSFLDLEAAMVVGTVGEILLTVPTQSLIASLSSSGNKGTYQGYYSAATSLGRSASNFVAPLSFQLARSQISESWYTVTVFSLFVAGLFRLSSKGVKNSIQNS